MKKRIQIIALGLVRSAAIAALGPDARAFIVSGVSTERVMNVALRTLSN